LIAVAKVAKEFQLVSFFSSIILSFFLTSSEMSLATLATNYSFMPNLTVGGFYQ